MYFIAIVFMKTMRTSKDEAISCYTTRSRRTPLDGHRTIRACRGLVADTTSRLRDQGQTRTEIAVGSHFSPKSANLRLRRQRFGTLAAAMQSMVLTFPFLPAATSTPASGCRLATRVCAAAADEPKLNKYIVRITEPKSQEES